MTTNLRPNTRAGQVRRNLTRIQRLEYRAYETMRDADYSAITAAKSARALRWAAANGYRFSWEWDADGAQFWSYEGETFDTCELVYMWKYCENSDDMDAIEIVQSLGGVTDATHAYKLDCQANLALEQQKKVTHSN